MPWCEKDKGRDVLEFRITKKHEIFEDDRYVHMFIVEMVSQMYIHVRSINLYTLNMCILLYSNYIPQYSCSKAFAFNTASQVKTME